MNKKAGLHTALLAGALLLSVTASATVPMGKQYAEHYNVTQPACTTCHTKSPKLNEYGAALKDALKGAKVITPEMFKACESKRPTP